MIVAYASGRIVQTTVSVSFPKCRARYSKFDVLMLPILMEGIARCLATRNDPVCNALAVGIDTAAYLIYKGAYALVQMQNKLIYLIVLEIILFGEPLFVIESGSDS